MNPLLQPKQPVTAEAEQPPQGGSPAILPQDQQDTGDYDLYKTDPGSPAGKDEARIMKALGIRDTASKEAALARKVAAYMNGYATAAEEYLKKYGMSMKHADKFAKDRGFRPKYFREAVQTMARYATVKKDKTSGAPMTNQGYGQGTVCPKCGQPIAQGAMVDWSGGVEQHAGACPPSGAQQPGSRLNLPKGYKPQPPRMAGKMDMQVVEEDGYVKVKHPRYGTVCAGIPGADGKVTNIEFLDPRYQKNNMIRIPAVKKLQQWEWLQSQKKQGSWQKTALDASLIATIAPFITLAIGQWLGARNAENFKQKAEAAAEKALVKAGVTDLPTLDAYAQKSGFDRTKAFWKLALPQVALALIVAGATMLTPKAVAQTNAPPETVKQTQQVIQQQAPAQAQPEQQLDEVKDPFYEKQLQKQQQKEREKQQLEQLRQQDQEKPERQLNVV